MAKTLTVLLAALALPWLIACSGGAGEPTAATEPPAEETAVDATGAVTITASPTVVARLTPPPTPTIDPSEQPLAPVPVDGLPDLVVPAAAVLDGEVEVATAGEAGRAHFRMADIDVDLLTDWFEEEWLLAGWLLGEERDGALVFVHGEQLSAQFSEEGLKRSATVFFDMQEDLDEGEAGFTIVAEAPIGTPSR